MSARAATSDETILDPKNMDAHLVEQHVTLVIARSEPS